MAPVVLVLLLVLVLLCLASKRSARAEGPPSGTLAKSTTAAYVINLRQRAERANDFLQHYVHSDLQDISIPIEVVTGVDGRKVDVQALTTPEAYSQIQLTTQTGKRVAHSHLTRGAVGCAMSHLECLRRFLATDKQYALIFEDDAVVAFRLGAAIHRTLQSVGHEWDVLLLGYYCLNCDVNSASHFFGLQSYMVTREGARKILRGCGPPFSVQIDSRMSQLAQTGYLRIARASESVVPQGQVAGFYATDIQTPVQA